MSSLPKRAEWTPATSFAVISLFAAAVFLNAALLFAVQPMFTKQVLPLLGGTPAVWNTCLLFFQGALLVGYGYAHVTSRLWLPSRQGAVHLAVLLVAAVFLPIALPAGASPPVGMAVPVLWLLGMLALSLGIPFTALAAGSPLLQRWFASTGHPRASNAYVLAVASNLGSFTALLSYPTLVEPSLTLGEQRLWWTTGYGVLVGLVGVVWWFTRRFGRSSDAIGEVVPRGNIERSAAFSDGPPSPTTGHSSALPNDGAPSLIPNRAWRLRWLLLSFAPSSLLLGVTSFLSTDVAAVPLLWVVPLALYLLTFVLVFAQRPPFHRGFMLIFQLLVAVALLVVIGMTPTKLKAAHVALHLLGFFATAMVCHRELADARPRAEHLTEFYLWMSLGGVLGGVFNVVVAPLLYDRVLEYPMALIIALGLRPSGSRADQRVGPVLFDLGLPMLLYAGLVWSFTFTIPTGTAGSIILWSLLGGAGILVSAFYRRPLRLALGAVALFLAIDQRGRSDDVIYQRRSFFGVYRVHQWGEFLVLQSGTTTHGAQSLRADQRKEPLTYYARMGPLGDALAVATDTTRPRSVAVVGLGTGTAACHARPGEVWTFYEIDPAMARLALHPKLFSYLRDCGPDDPIKLGDARIMLQRAPDAAYDLIALDAFSSDAIPVHLLTREAVALYLKKLKPRGTILFHISNRYLDLEPVVAQLARDAKLAGAAGDFQPSDSLKRRMMYASRWIALSRDAAILAPLVVDRGWRVLAPRPTARLWTDDFSDVFGALKRE